MEEVAEKATTDEVPAKNVAVEKVAAEKVAAEKVAARKVAAVKVAAEKVATEKVAKVAAEKVAAEKFAAEKATAEKGPAQKQAAEASTSCHGSPLTGLCDNAGKSDLAGEILPLSLSPRTVKCHVCACLGRETSLVLVGSRCPSCWITATDS